MSVFFTNDPMTPRRKQCVSANPANVVYQVNYVSAGACRQIFRRQGRKRDDEKKLLKPSVQFTLVAGHRYLIIYRI
jgi:hypothetical protein